ncbi:DTW domain-containing protein [Massilia sp. TW-1]|uniref:tRNA-uridine aminocarboxypropyltransferase n=1 Tax=Telluria antibiotica TaxID=2717319 RepID=A0ABX0P9C3_9BURK|nr:tRNA-uridine aminocarboxypropyltransferase [Telluria antibiotica]NIA53900.1 DTW domain-containing protein [Telluria antibiotica]
MTVPSTTTRRATCAACLRAQSACICHWVRPLSSRVDLVILQHPLEVRNAKNSARLLHLCVTGSRLEVGEAFEPAALHHLLYAGGRVPLLLYPETPGDAPAPVPDPSLLAQPEGLRLVVLDATWRKSRKMLHLNAGLQRLPRLALHDMPASAYRIRKAHAPHQLSSLEAAALALAQLEGDPDAYRPLLQAFDGFVQQQAALFSRLNPS